MSKYLIRVAGTSARYFWYCVSCTLRISPLTEFVMAFSSKIRRKIAPVFNPYLASLPPDIFISRFANRTRALLDDYWTVSTDMPPQEISSFIITNNPGCQTSRGRRHSACPGTFSQSIRGSRENAMRIAYMLVCVSGDIILPLIFAMPPAWVSRLRVGC